MAEGKKSFLLYADLINIVSKLPDETAGKLLKLILEYVNDKDPVVDDLLLSIAFEPIKLQLKRDLIKWSGEKELKSSAGILGNLKRWHLDLYELHIDKKISLERALEIAEDRKTSHTDDLPSHKVAEIAVTVNVTDKDIIIKDQFDLFWKKYPKKVAKESCFKKFKKLTDTERTQILDNVDAFSAYKPFETYNHPNPETYINQKRFNDEVPQEKKVSKGYTPQMTN